MRRMVRLIWLVMLAWVPAASSAGPVPPERLAAFLDQRVGRRLASEHVAGATIAVVQGGRVTALRGYGRAGIRPDRAVDPAHTLFGLASMSKLFTWLVLLKAAEAGRIDLNRPVNDYLPPDLRIPDQGFRRPIRFVDLLRHTTGFEDRDLTVLSPKSFGGHQPSITDYLRHARPEREREPGGDPNYSNYSPSLAAFVALRGTGASDFDTLVERELFVPLGMASTTFREPPLPGTHLSGPMPAALAARRTQNLLWDGHAFYAHGYEHMMDGPASAASATAADMARFMLALLRDGTLDGRRAWGPGVARAIRSPLLDGVQSNRWAHGFMMFALPGGHVGYGHDGGTTTTASTLVVVPDLDLGIFAATNSLAGGRIVYDLASDLVREFYARGEPGPGHPRPGSPALAREADRYAGTYLSARRPYHGLALLVRAETQPVTVDDAGYLHVASGGRDRRWVPAGSPGAFVDAEGPEVLAFRFGADGRAISFRDPLATRTVERVSPLLAMPILMTLAVASVLCAVVALLAGAVRAIRRRRGRAGLPTPVARFDRVQLIGALLLFGALGCLALSATMADQASGAPFPPLPLRLFALTACAIAASLLLLAIRAPAMWRATGRVGAGLRVLAMVPLALLLLRIGFVGGFAFWS